MIPLIIFLIVKTQNTNTITKDRLKHAGIWLIPVILIPMIWPFESYIALGLQIDSILLDYKNILQNQCCLKE